MNSLRARLIALLMLSMLAVAALIGSITFQKTLKENEKLFDHHLRQTALALRDQGFAEGEELDIYAEEALDTFVRVWRLDGSILYQSHPGTPLPPSAILGFDTAAAGGTLWRVYTMPTLTRVIQVAQPLAARRELAGMAALRSLSPLLAFAPLMGFLIWWLIGREFQSVRRLEREVTRRHAQSLDAVPENGLPSEIAPVVRALNSLLERLRRAFQAQSAFISDAAHELRSPVTALTLQVDVLDHAKTDQEKDAAIVQLRAGVARANRLIEQLLSAARTEPTEAIASFASVSLAEISRRVIAECYVDASDRNIAFEFNADGDAMMHGDEAQLQALVRNLLENAIRYTPENGRVSITLATGPGGRIFFTIDDSGPGIPENEHRQVFRRFYRCDTTGKTGTGLGLAIVRNVASQHGASVRLRRSTFGGLCVEVIFPAPADSHAQRTDDIGESAG
jgi:two-component system OmpR family sensor kinase/two-component system sensor histidine kinase QseC